MVDTPKENNGDDIKDPVEDKLPEKQSMRRHQRRGSKAAESAASAAGLRFLSSEGAFCSGSRARAVTGAIPWVWSNDRFKSCSSRWQGAAAVGVNPSKIKSPRISAA